MANDLTKDPWIIDTAGAGDIFTGQISPRLLRWVGATAAGHQCLVKDSSGRVLWDAIADADKFNDQTAVDVKAVWNGLKVTVLTSGTLYIYMR